MCGECCAELGRWRRAFTNTEVLLSVLEALLLVLLIALLTFVLLHFLACSRKEYVLEPTPPPTSTEPPPNRTTTRTPAPGETCSWKPGSKTDAVTRYYEQNGTKTDATNSMQAGTTPRDELLPDLTDGEVAERSYNQFVLALVKVRPPQDITFGCIMTIVDEFWAVTAASCIEAIEEVDSLDSFVMMEDYGERSPGKTHAVADVLLHPWYAGKNKSFDLVALKSEDSLVKGSKAEVELPSALDYFLTTIGEKFTILGYGGYRTVDQSPLGRRLRWVSSFVVSPAQCGGPQPAREAWSPRHLSRPHAAPHGVCGARELCAGALSARGAACNYCAGAPMLRGATLVGVMSDNPHCGVACEPVLFVNVALVRPWLDALLANDDVA